MFGTNRSRKHIVCVFVAVVTIVGVNLLLYDSIYIKSALKLVRWSRKSAGFATKSHTEKQSLPQGGTVLPPCPAMPPGLVGKIPVNKTAPDWKYLKERFTDLAKGGRWKPPNCVANHRVAIIIPYRDREEHLRVFLQHIHPFLQKQQLDYGIYLIEPDAEVHFNRGMLLNIGYIEAAKIHNYQCFILHDVDLLPENDLNLYTCPNSPRHMSVAVDKFKYKLPYEKIFGGVAAMPKEQMTKVNGYSNLYFGWGCEDDDMRNRIVDHGLNITRYPPNVARYNMLGHKRGWRRPNQRLLLWRGRKRQDKEGLNSIQYDVTSIEYRSLYTLVKVHIDEEKIMQKYKDLLN